MPPEHHPTTLFLDQLLEKEQSALTACVGTIGTPLMSKSQIDDYRAEQTAMGTGRKNLENLLDAIRFLIEESGVKLGYIQEILLNTFIRAFLPRLFGAEMPAEINFLRAKFGSGKFTSGASATVPRRAGKTTVQTLFSAAVLVSQPDGNVCSFNLTSRQSKTWFTLVDEHLQRFQKSDRFQWTELTRNNREVLILRSKCTGTTNTLSSYPGPSDKDASNWRGMGTRLAIMNIDEFYFMKPFVYPTLIPLLTNGAIILLTSSQSKDADNPIRRMLEAILPDGSKVLTNYNWLQSCSDCKAIGKEEQCTHIERRPQHFQKQSDIRRVRALMKAFGDGAAEREMGNVAATDWTERVFPQEWLDVFKEPHYLWGHPQNPEGHTALPPVKHIFIGYDPAGEGMSKNAIVSAIFDTSSPRVGTPYNMIVRSLYCIDINIRRTGEIQIEWRGP